MLTECPGSNKVTIIDCKGAEDIDCVHVSQSDQVDPDHLNEAGTNPTSESSEKATVYASRFLRFIPGIFITMGILSCIQMAVALCTSHIDFIFSIFCIPVGIGLGKFQYSSYRWARFWAVLSVFGCLLMVVICGYGHWKYHNKPWYPPTYIKITSATFFGLAAIFMYKVDRTLRDHKSLYQPARPFRVRHPRPEQKIVYGERPPEG